MAAPRPASISNFCSPASGQEQCVDSTDRYHTSGIPDIWLTGWLESHFGTRRRPFHVVGPTGAKALMANLEKAYAADIDIRTADEKLPREGVALQVEEFNADGAIYRKNGVTVIAFEVDHGDVIKPAYGYRIEYGGRSVVISGDTRFNENVIKFGTGADLPTWYSSPVRMYRLRRWPTSLRRREHPMMAHWKSERT